MVPDLVSDIESLRKLGTAFGPQYTMRTRSRGEPINFRDMASGHRPAHDRHLPLSVKDGCGRYGAANTKFRTDPHWKDEVALRVLPRHNGAGIGASHQTG